MAENPIEDASGLLKALGISGEQLQNAKLGPGIVGRNTVIAWVFLIVMLVGILCSYGLHNNFLLTLCLIFAFIVAIRIRLPHCWKVRSSCSINSLRWLLEVGQLLRLEAQPNQHQEV